MSINFDDKRKVTDITVKSPYVTILVIGPNLYSWGHRMAQFRTLCHGVRTRTKETAKWIVTKF